MYWRFFVLFFFFFLDIMVKLLVGEVVKPVAGLVTASRQSPLGSIEVRLRVGLLCA